MPADSRSGWCREEWARPALALALLVVVALQAALTLHPFEQDVTVYHNYGLRLLHGSREGRLPVEYPALAALVFVLPLVLHLPYALGFGALMGVAFVVLAVAGRSLGADGPWLGRTVVYLGLGTVAVLFARYDLVPAVATFVAVMQARRQRWGSAWVAGMLGGVLKLFPFLLLPGFFLAEWRASGKLPWRRAALATIVLAGGAAAQQLLAPGTLLSPFRYEVRRGFEFSSVGGSLTALVDPLHLHWRSAFMNWEIFGSYHAAIAAGLACCAFAGIAGSWLLAWRGQLGVDSVSLAVLSVAVLTDRALAPQYLIWLAPLWALWPRRRSWVAAAALTTLTFPVAFALTATHAHFLTATLVATARNVTLIAGTLAWFHEQLKTGVPAAVYQDDMADHLLRAAGGSQARSLVAAGARAMGQPVVAVGRRTGGGATSPLDGG